MNIFKKTLIASALVTASVAAQADTSINLGVTTDYIWRGVSQSGGSASVSGGIDYSDDSGFYAGTWVGSLGDAAAPAFNGSEVDLYFGYGTDAFDIGYIYYHYPSVQGDIDFGEIYGSYSFGALTAGLAVTVNNGSSNDDAQFAEGDIYYYISGGTDLSENWTIGATLGAYTYDTPADDDSVLDDYVHLSVDFGTSTDAGDFTFTLTTTDADNDDIVAVVSYGVAF